MGVQMHHIKKTIENHEYIVYGANADLITWIQSAALASQALNPANITVDDLFRAFGSHTESARVDWSKKLVKRIWHSDPTLGPYPFLDTLSEFQFDRLFYPNYRDHVCHQLKVYLLGLFIYDQCPQIRDELDRTLNIPGTNPTAEFLTRWLVTSLYHDVGYVLENDEGLQSGGTAWEKTRTDLNNTLKSPLSTMPAFSELITSDVEQRLIQTNQIFTPKVLTLTDIETYKKINLLDQLGEEASRARLGTGDSPFRDYYNYTLTHDVTHPTSSRGRFRDHGIASALLLMRTWRSFSDYVADLCAKAGADPLIKPHFAQVDQLAKNLSLRAESIRAAAAAMALHNINGNWWDPAEALGCGLTLRRFKICLSEDGYQLPLAFLLGLVDSLQDWDRPRYRAKREHDPSVLLDQDISITSSEGKLWLYLPSDAEKYRDPTSSSDSAFSRARSAMKEYLESKAIDDFIAWTDAPRTPMSTTTVPSTPAAPPSAMLGPQLPMLDRLPQSFQSYGKANLFMTGTALIIAAKRRVILVAKTPIPVVGTRPYDESVAPPYYEKEQYDAYTQIINKATALDGIEFLCVGSTSALVTDVTTVSEPERSTFCKRIADNLLHLSEAGNAAGSRCILRWTDDPRPMTFLVADDNFIIWLKDERSDSVCLTAESTLVADALAHTAFSMSFPVTTDVLMASIIDQ
jgi:hypothetical protein